VRTTLAGSERIRATCVDSSHRPVVDALSACNSLTCCPKIRERRDQPIELDPSLVRGLTEHALAESPAYDPEIQALNVALLRFRAENDF
jgi:Holliday junction resolvase